MSTEIQKTETTAIEKPEHPLLAMLNDTRVIRRFEQAAGAQAGQMMVNILNAAALNPEIWNCEPASVINAALTAATLDLSLAPSLGQAAIVPFKEYSKNGDAWDVKAIKATLIPMVRGLKMLALRTNKYRVLNAFFVYDGQEVVEDQLSGRKTIEGKRLSDTIIGYGAYLLLTNGFEAVVYWPKNAILAHAQKYSKSWDKSKKQFNPKSFWATDFDKQGLKTALRDLIMNHGEISTRDRAVLETISVDGEIVEPARAEFPDDIEGEGEPEKPTRYELRELKTSDGRELGNLSVVDLQAVSGDVKELKIIRDAALELVEIATRKGKGTQQEIMSELGF